MSAYRAAYRTPQGGKSGCPTIALTSKFVETATSNGKPREFYWDETLPGFGLMVTDTGSSSFVIQYRNADGVSRR